LPRTTNGEDARRVRDAANKRRRSALQRREVSDQRCEVPGCEGGALVNEDGDITSCCYEHSLAARGSEPETLQNDAIIDWTAIEAAVQGSRPVNLTWVEKDIVMATILARGGNITTALERTGVHHQCVSQGRRADSVRQIMQAIEQVLKEHPYMSLPDLMDTLERL
jgi:hypothetical protein